MKKFVAILLSTVMTFTCSAGAYADDRGLADAILKAKEYVSVPEDQNEIEFNIIYQENEIAGYQLSWYGEDDYTSVSLDLDGCLISYYTNGYKKDESDVLANYTMEQTEITAGDFLKIAYGDNAEYFKLTDSTCYTDNHTYVYTAYQGDIPIAGSYAVIKVDSFNNAVYSFSGCQQEYFSLEYPEPAGVIAPGDAMLSLYDNDYPMPAYVTSTTYGPDEIKHSAYLAFYTSGRGRGVDAFTGEPVDINYIYDSNPEINYADAGSAESTSDASGVYTPEELAAIATVENLISQEQAENIIKDCFPIVLNEDFSDYRVYSNTSDNSYYIQLRSDNASATLDGESGLIQSFNFYGAYEDKDETESNIIETAQELISKAAYDIEEDLSPVSYVLSSSGAYGSYRAYRMENGYKSLDEGITMHITDGGYVTTYYRTWYDDISYPNPDNVLTGKAAVTALEDVFDFGLVYSIDDNYNVSLAYTFGEFGNMSATSPQMVDYKGQIMEEEVEPSISDVEGHWAEKYITPLFNSGYRITDTAFRPDQPITYGELKELFGSNYSWAFYRDEAEDEKPDDSEVTRYELAEYIVNYCGYSGLMDYPHIFTTNFEDEIDREYLPAVAIACGLNILTGDENNCFNGAKEITRAEAAVALYNLVCNID